MFDVPPISVNAVEALWIGLNAVTALLTVFALLDARADAAAVKALNGRAKEIVARGNVRREWFRLIIQFLLLGVALPGLFTAREVSLNLVVIVLMSIPAILLLQSILDAMERHRLAVALRVKIMKEEIAEEGRIANLEMADELRQEHRDAHIDPDPT
jgi:hypothetical protein